MFRRSIMLTLSLAAILSGCAKDKNELAQDLEKQKTRGAEIVAQYQKQESHPSQHVQLRMSITSPAESEKVYEFEIWRKRDQNQSKSLLRVVKPDSEKGFVSLSTQSNDAEPVSVSYNPLSQQFAESGGND